MKENGNRFSIENPKPKVPVILTKPIFKIDKFMDLKQSISENIQDSPYSNNKGKAKNSTLLQNRNFSFDIMKTNSSSKNSLSQNKNKIYLNLSSEFPLTNIQCDKSKPTEKAMQPNKITKELNTFMGKNQIVEKKHTKTNILKKDALLKENYQFNNNEKTFRKYLNKNPQNNKTSPYIKVSPDSNNSIKNSSSKSLNEKWMKRQNDFQIIKRRKIKMLENEILVNELKNCTFEPSINNSNQEMNYRTADQFFDDQIKYVELKNKKVIEINEVKKNQEINICRFPVISARTKINFLIFLQYVYFYNLFIF